VAADAAGDVFVAEADNNQVVEIAPSGEQTTVSTQFAPAGTPQGVASDAKGDVFVGYTTDNEVVKVTPFGTSTTVLSAGLDNPEGLAVDAAGDVYLADTDNNRVVEVTPGGSETDVGSGLSLPGDVALAPVAPVPATSGQSVTLTAYAFPTGAGAPSGQVTFSLGPTVLGAATLATTSSGSDKATLKTTALPAGTDTVTASYGGDSTYSGSSASATVDVSLAISPKKLSAATVGTPYSAKLTAAGGTAPYVFARSSGTLPHGIHLSSSGSLTGTPSAAGTFRFTIKVTDASDPANSGQRIYSVVVDAGTADANQGGR
jgi:hypothetical protein